MIDFFNRIGRFLPIAAVSYGLETGNQLSIEILDGVMVLKPVRDTTTVP